MAGLVPNGSHVDAKRYHSRIHELLSRGGSESEELFTPYDEVCESFEAMGLRDNLLRGIYAYGFKKPSATQQRGIIPFCRGLDVVQQAHSGTGRTATLCSGILQRLDIGLVECQALVLVPTRELAEENARVLHALGEYLGVKAHGCIGGTSVVNDRRIVENGVHVVLGTPGHIFDLLQSSRSRRQFLRTEFIKMLVLDDTDKLLSGFKEQIYSICKRIPSEIQVGVFSTTMPPGVFEIARKLMKNPVRIHVKRGERTLDGIQQFYLDVEKEDWKFDTLLDLYETIGMSKSIIFVNTRRKMEWLASNMRKKDFATVSTIHGDMDQNDRDNIMRELRDHTIGILITSDQLPCGVDVRRNFVAINYDLPTKPENYLHRIGRSDESCWKHIAINFVTRDDKRMMNDIQRFYNVTIEVLPEPDDIADLL